MAFVEVGAALMRIRDGRKYQKEGFATFEEYCRERWGMSRTYSFYLIEAAETATDLFSNENLPEPVSEAQMRPLRALPTPEAKHEAWRDSTEEYGPRPTMAQGFVMLFTNENRAKSAWCARVGPPSRIK